MSSYPISLNLAGKRVVVIGAGSVAARRVISLIEAGARVLVISPSSNSRIAELAQAGSLEFVERTYFKGDLDGAWLVHAATNDAQVNERVAADADAQGTWCIRADKAMLSEAWTPASTRVDEITVAVTAGGDPLRAIAIRDAGFNTGGFGNRVIVNHGYGYETWYGHMYRIKARVGERVKRGEVIGYVGNTGKSTGPHCHYEVHRGGKPVDPIYYFYNDLTPAQFDRILKLAAVSNQSFD